MRQSFHTKWKQLASICIFGTIGMFPLASSVMAAFDRYPTEVEIQSAMGDFHQAVTGIPGPGARDRRSPLDVTELSSFIEDWSQFDSSIAPFLGTYSGVEETLRIYPSRNRGQVCIIRSGYGRNGVIYTFGLGRVTENKIYTTGDLGQQILFPQRGGTAGRDRVPNEQRNYLVLVGIYNDQTILNAWGLPTPLESPDDSVSEEFRKFDCMLEKP
jgi:hypothetical protein